MVWFPHRSGLSVEKTIDISQKGVDNLIVLGVALYDKVMEFAKCGLG